MSEVTQTQREDTCELEFTARGRIKYFEEWVYKACETTIGIRDHPMNQQIGQLVLEVVCGAKKRDRKKILLSAGAKAVMKNLLLEDKNINTVVEFISRREKLPKLIVSNDQSSNDIILMGVFGGGRRGGVWAYTENNSKMLMCVGAANLAGAMIITFTHMPPGGRLVVERHGRLYDAERYLIIVNEDGRLKTIYADSLKELEVDMQ